MKIAVIGTGNMGAGFARTFASSGVDVVIGHRDPAKHHWLLNSAPPSKAVALRRP